MLPRFQTAFLLVHPAGHPRYFDTPTVAKRDAFPGRGCVPGSPQKKVLRAVEVMFVTRMHRQKADTAHKASSSSVVVGAAGIPPFQWRRLRSSSRGSSGQSAATLGERTAPTSLYDPRPCSTITALCPSSWKRPREIHLRRTHLDSTTRYRFPEYPCIDCTAAPTQHANCYKAASPQPGHDIGVPGPRPSTLSLHTAEPTCTQSDFRLGLYSDLKTSYPARFAYDLSPRPRAPCPYPAIRSRRCSTHPSRPRTSTRR